MNGILLVDKPKGWTSFDVVNYVRKIVRQPNSQDSRTVGLSDRHKSNQDRLSDYQTGDYPTKPLPKVKVGHTGTLDPLATGLLVLLLGDYTKRAPELSKLDKTYEVTMKLGETSTTGDAEGTITPFRPPKRSASEAEGSLRFGRDDAPARDEVLKVFEKFTGEIMQTPPAYSAVKVNGQRAYKLARAGKTVAIEPRKIKVNSIQLTAYSYPLVEFTADVSSGTYIRALVEDIGIELQTGAYMTALRRTRVGQFNLKDARQVKDKNLLQNIFLN